MPALAQPFDGFAASKQPLPVHIRPAVIDDVPSIAAIYLATQAQDSPDRVLDIDTCIQRFAAIFYGTSRDIIHDVFVADLLADKQTVGFAAVIRNSPDLPLRGSEVDFVHVSPQYQKQGVGRQLLQKIRQSNGCESWMRLKRSDTQSLDWCKRQDYRYNHTEMGENGTKTVLQWPGRVTSRPATIHDLSTIESFFVKSVFENPEIVHGTSVPTDFGQSLIPRIFPHKDSSYASDATIYETTSGEFAGFSVVHYPAIPLQSKQCDLNIFFTNQALEIKDLGNYMIQRVFEKYNARYSVEVKTWSVNRRSLAFYSKNGFKEVSRETEEEAAKESRPIKVTLRKDGPPSMSDVHV